MFASFNLYFFSLNFCVSVFLIKSLFYYSAIRKKLSVSVCVCEREEEKDIFLVDPTLSSFHKAARKF